MGKKKKKKFKACETAQFHVPQELACANILHSGSGAHPDRKKQKNKRACRGKANFE